MADRKKLYYLDDRKPLKVIRWLWSDSTRLEPGWTEKHAPAGMMLVYYREPMFRVIGDRRSARERSTPWRYCYFGESIEQCISRANQRAVDDIVRLEKELDNARCKILYVCDVKAAK